MNLASILLSHAVARPRKTAIVSDAEMLDYADVARLAGSYAARLADGGVGLGDRVGLALADTPDHLILHYALAWLGATIVPIDHRWSVPEKQAVAQAFNCRVTISEDEILGVESVRFEAAWRDAAVTVPR